MIKIKSGDIVLFKYPYSDYSGVKRRPVLVIAERPDFKNEFLITFLTSQTLDFNKDWDIELNPESKRDQQTNLKKKTVIKTTKLMIISYSRLTGKIGMIDKSVLKQVKENIKRWLAGEKR
ncbi:mRNA interferase MazF [Candidatus Methanophagaceae archaeon]|jgi:mRNA-degrading endonuclease toxin of MazEF toxin-antitoxin module|nr:mRNA interferase MazF [Methanophagales archaeon]